MTAKNNVAAQAGDEPMLLDVLAAKIAEFYPQSTPFDMEKNQRLARAILRLPLQRDARNPAAPVSTRATADVERDALAMLREVVRLDGISLVATIDNCDICTTIEFDKLTDDIRKYIATTKPGA